MEYRSMIRHLIHDTLTTDKYTDVDFGNPPEVFHKFIKITVIIEFDVNFMRKSRMKQLENYLLLTSQ